MYLLIISRIFDTIPVIDIGRSILIREGCVKEEAKFYSYKYIKKELEKGKSMKKSLHEDIVFFVQPEKVQFDLIEFIYSNSGQKLVCSTTLNYDVMSDILRFEWSK